MVNVNYTLNVSPSVAETYLASTEFAEGQFFVKKEEGLVSLDIKLSDDLDFSSQIYAINKTSSKYKVLTNTTDILATNITVDGTSYYYRLESLGEAVDYKTVILNSSVQCINHMGGLYTNEEVYNLELSPGLFVFSVPVINPSEGQVKFRAKDIEITFPASLGELQFKCKGDSVITPTLINDSKIALPSFYIKKGNSFLKCIEGDIKLINKKELAYFVGNSISCKDMIHSYSGNFYSKATNKIYLDFFNYKTTPAIVRYTAKQSSHIFLLKQEQLHFKIKPTGIELTTEVEADFTVTKKYDLSKIHVIESKYLTTYRSELNPKDYVLVADKITDQNEAVSFTKQVETNLTKFPSQVTYIEYKNRYILQHNNDILPTTHNDLVEEDVFSDCLFEFKDNPKIYDDYKFTKIADTYYYKNSKPYYTALLFEEDDPILLEDALNFLLEF